MKKIDLKQYGIENVAKIIHNPSYETLFDAEIDPKNQSFESGVVTELGAVNFEQFTNNEVGRELLKAGPATG